MIIRDGFGGGSVAARVDPDGNLHTHARVFQEIHAASRLGLAYSIRTPRLTVTATAGHILWLNVTENDYYFVVDRLLLGWNGGSTNHNRCVYVDMYVGTPAPTGNNTVVVPGNLNANSTRNLTGTFYEWDEVGAGMTVAADGVLAGSYMFGQGITSLDIHNSLILSPAYSLSFKAQGEEAGELVGVVSGFLTERSSN